MRKTKIFSILLTVTLVTSLMAGCGSSKKSEPVATTKTLDKSPITLTFYSADGNAKSSNFTDAVAKEITKRTGVTLKIQYPVGGTSKVPLMIAGGEYPDLIYAKGDESKIVSAKGLISLDKYLGKAENIKKLYGTYLPRLKDSVDDPTTYTVGSFGVSPIGTEIWTPGGLFQIQHAVLKDQGYPKLQTLKEYGDAIKTYMQKYPTINGQKTIGLSLCADDWRWLITVGNPSGSAVGLPGDGQWAIDPDTNKAQYKFMLPEIKEYYRWLNGMNASGVLDPESFTQKFDQYKAKLTSGRVLAISDAGWDYADATASLNKINQQERTFATLPVVLDAKYKDASMKDLGWGGGTGVAITTSCNNPDRAMQFLDWMASDEAQILTNWGIEGVNYTIVDGKRVISAAERQKSMNDPDYGTDTGVGLYTYPFPQRGQGVKDPTGQYYSTATTQSITDNYNSAMKETLKAYGATMEKDMYPKTSEFKTSPFGAAWMTTIPQDSDLTIILKKADDESQKSIPKAILAKPADFDKVWDEYIATLKKIEIEKAGTDFTKLLADKSQLWSK